MIGFALRKLGRVDEAMGYYQTRAGRPSRPHHDAAISGRGLPADRRSRPGAESSSPRSPSAAAWPARTTSCWPTRSPSTRRRPAERLTRDVPNGTCEPGPALGRPASLLRSSSVRRKATRSAFSRAVSRRSAVHVGRQRRPRDEAAGVVREHGARASAASRRACRARVCATSRRLGVLKAMRPGVPPGTAPRPGSRAGQADVVEAVVGEAPADVTEHAAGLAGEQAKAAHLGRRSARSLAIDPGIEAGRRRDERAHVGRQRLDDRRLAIRLASSGNASPELRRQGRHPARAAAEWSASRRPSRRPPRSACAPAPPAMAARPSQKKCLLQARFHSAGVLRRSGCAGERARLPAAVGEGALRPVATGAGVLPAAGQARVGEQLGAERDRLGRERDCRPVPAACRVA